MSPDPVRQFLRRRGVARHLLTGGIDGLISRWGDAVARLATRPAPVPEEFLNDLDLRQLIHEAMPHVLPGDRTYSADRLAQIDRQFQALTRPTSRCAWGPEVAVDAGWNASEHWWYFVALAEGSDD